MMDVNYVMDVMDVIDVKPFLTQVGSRLCVLYCIVLYCIVLDAFLDEVDDVNKG
jgi:hypothetical protein